MQADEFPKVDKIRFFVVDAENRPISDLWFVENQGTNVYVAPTKLGGQLKLSLHTAGGAKDGCDCQFGHPRSHADEQARLGFQPMQPIRWTRQPTPKIGAIHLVSIFFPTDYLGIAPGPADDGKLKFALTAAPSGHAVEAALFISSQGPDCLEQPFLRSSALPLVCMELSNGEFVSFVVRHTPFPDLTATLKKAETLPAVPLSGAPALGEEVSGRAIMVGEVPAGGQAFRLIEAGPLSISRDSSKI